MGGKGISSSALPYRRSVPSWQKSTAEEIKDVIYKLAKKGYKPSLIDVHLRDTSTVVISCIATTVDPACTKPLTLATRPSEKPSIRIRIVRIFKSLNFCPTALAVY